MRTHPGQGPGLPESCKVGVWSILAVALGHRLACQAVAGCGMIYPAWKKETGTEPAVSFRGFDIFRDSEPVPIFHKPTHRLGIP